MTTIQEIKLKKQIGIILEDAQCTHWSKWEKYKPYLIDEAYEILIENVYKLGEENVIEKTKKEVKLGLLVQHPDFKGWWIAEKDVLDILDKAKEIRTPYKIINPINKKDKRVLIV